MKHFQISLHDYNRACQVLWERQDALALPRARIYLRSIGTLCVLWISDPMAEKSFQQVLQDLQIPYKELTPQETTDFFAERIFGE